MAEDRLGDSGLQVFLRAQNPWFQAKMAEIYRFSHQLAAANSLEALYQEIVRETTDILEVDSCRLLLAADGGEWICEAEYPALPHPTAAKKTAEPVPASSIYHQAAEKNGLTFIQRGSSSWAGLESPFTHSRRLSGLCLIPMIFRNERIGMLVLGQNGKSSFKAFEEEKKQLGTFIAEQSAGAVYRAITAHRLQENRAETVQALSKTIEMRDDDTGGHSTRMTQLAERIAAACHCSDDEIQVIRWAGQLHDIGKIGIPDSILHKPGPLDDAEWAVVRRHPDVGADIVLMVSNLASVADLIRAHHERYDGSGYPRRLSGLQIPMGARILAIADAYSAMTDGRSYHPAFSHNEAADEIKNCSGTYFDPWIVEAFLSLYQ